MRAAVAVFFAADFVALDALLAAFVTDLTAFFAAVFAFVAGLAFLAGAFRAVGFLAVDFLAAVRFGAAFLAVVFLAVFAFGFAADFLAVGFLLDLAAVFLAVLAFGLAAFDLAVDFLAVPRAFGFAADLRVVFLGFFANSSFNSAFLSSCPSGVIALTKSLALAWSFFGDSCFVTPFANFLASSVMRFGLILFRIFLASCIRLSGVSLLARSFTSSFR